MSLESLLSVRDFCAEFGSFALRDIALEVRARERVGIVGESGSGKSLLVKLIMGLVQGSVRGEIHLQGIEQNLATCPINSPIWRSLRAAKIAYIPQSPKLSLNPLHTISKQLAEMCALHLPNTPKPKHQALIDHALESVGLEPSIKHRLPHTLSGGQAQRVCIAMMSLARPKLLICDEPTTALDAHIQSQILALLDSFTEMAIVFITHDLGLIGKFAKRVYVMQGGRICDHLATGDSVLGEQCGSVALCGKGTTTKVANLYHKVQSSHSPTATPRILEESHASRSSSRALQRQSVAIHKSTQVDSRVLESNAQNVFCSQAHRRQDLGDKNGALQARARAHTWSYVIAARAKQSPFLASKPTPKTQKPALHPYTRKLLDAITLPKKVDSSGGEVCFCLREFGVHYTAKGFLTKQKIPAIQGVNLRLSIGDSIGVIGASGSGKSSLALGILGLERQSGLIELYSRKSPNQPAIYTSKKRDRAFVSMVQIVFQDPLLALNPRSCVLEILQEALRAREGGRSVLESSSYISQVTRLLEQVGLSSEFLYRYSQNLSGGEAQRVCIARALASGATILLLDEPTSALDKSTQKDIITLLLELQCTLGLSYLVISHDLSVIEAMCSGVLVLDSGRVVEQGAVAEVFGTPTHASTKALLQARI